MSRKQPDYAGAVEIARDIYWVGHRSTKEFESNAYLRVFRGQGKQFNLLIDPGPSQDFKYVAAKIEQVLGANYHLDMVFLNHQDPDVCINAVYFQRHFPSLYVLTSEDTWRLVRFYGLKEQQFIATENFKSGLVKTSTGHYFKLIPTPYAHFRGACCLYDMEQRVLFSGDLFGGLSASPDLYADKDYWHGVKIFHQLYMPSNIALKGAVQAFRQAASDMRLIAPQHGKCIEAGLIEHYMRQLEQLPVGMDLAMPSKLYAENYLKAFNEILAAIRRDVDERLVTDLLAAFRSDGSFPNIFVTKNGAIIGLKTAPDNAVNILISELHAKMLPSQYQPVRAIIINTLADWNIAADVHFPDLAGDNITMQPLDGLFSIAAKDVDTLFDTFSSPSASSKGPGQVGHSAHWRVDGPSKVMQ